MGLNYQKIHKNSYSKSAKYRYFVYNLRFLKLMNDEVILDKLIMENVDNLEMDIDDVRKMCSLIESHMGKWNTNKYSKVELPIPNNELERFAHRCDYLASRNYLNIKFLNNDNDYLKK